MPATVTQPLAAPRLVEVTSTERGWKVLLHNDDVTPIEVVVYALQRAAGLSLELAEAVTIEAHHEGHAVVKRGLTREDALIVCGGLRKWSRVDGVCPGVQCEAEPDDENG